MNAIIFYYNDWNRAKEKITSFINEKEGKEIESLLDPDIFVIKPDGESIKISQIKELWKNLSKPPLKLKYQYTIIKSSEKMTIPAQNSLLKSLEEPGINHFILLCSKNPNLLLDTIKSRCLLLKTGFLKKSLSREKIAELDMVFDILNQKRPGKMLGSFDFVKNRKQAIEFCNDMILYMRTKVITCNNYRLLKPLKKLISSRNRIKKNANPKLSLDNWAIKSFWQDYI